MKAKVLNNSNISQTIGSPIYAMHGAKHGITFIIGMLSRYTSNLWNSKWLALTRVLRYIKGIHLTMNYTMGGIPQYLNSIMMPLGIRVMTEYLLVLWSHYGWGSNILEVQEANMYTSWIRYEIWVFCPLICSRINKVAMKYIGTLRNKNIIFNPHHNFRVLV